MNHKLFLFAIVLALTVTCIEGNILSKLFGGGQAAQPATNPAYPGVNFQSFLAGEWIVEKLIRTQESADADPVFDRFNLTIRATNISAHYDLETVEEHDKTPAFKIRTDGAWTGAFMIVDENVKKPATHTGEVPEEDEFVSEVDPASLKEVFKYNFVPRANGFVISYGVWEPTAASEKARTYTFLISSPTSFLLSIYDTDHLVEFTAKKSPSREVLPWYKQFGSSGLMIGFFILMQIMKRFVGPQPEQAPRPSGASAPSKASPSTKAAKSKKAQ